MERRDRIAELQRNRRFAAVFLGSILVLGTCFLLRPATDRAIAESASTASPTGEQSASAAAPSWTGQLSFFNRIGGRITPKSVTASSTGLVMAANMMYGHNVTVYAADTSAQGVVDDAVDLSRFNITGHAGTVKGAPVEAAFTPDGQYAYVTNYAMSGKGFGPEPRDTCSSDAQLDPSYVYRLTVAERAVSGAVQVGAVPKSVLVTPDGRTVLVANWCSGDLSVIDTARNALLGTVKLGKYPLGVAVSADSRTGYVALSGQNKVVSVDLGSVANGTAQPQDVVTTASGPRHIVVSSDGRTLFVAANDANTVQKVDLSTRAVVAQVKVGRQPRNLALSPDGTALYVASYGSGTLTKLRSGDLAQVQEVKVDSNPVGVTYEPTQRRVWVACYGGTILVFDDGRAHPSNGPSGPTSLPSGSGSWSSSTSPGGLVPVPSGSVQTAPGQTGAGQFSSGQTGAGQAESGQTAPGAAVSGSLPPVVTALTSMRTPRPGPTLWPNEPAGAPTS